MSDPVIYVVPAKGLTVPLPNGRACPARGDFVERNEYVRRRLADGDLVLADPPAEPEPTEVPAEPEPVVAAPAEAEAAAEPATKRRRS